MLKRIRNIKNDDDDVDNLYSAVESQKSFARVEYDDEKGNVFSFRWKVFSACTCRGAYVNGYTVTGCRASNAESPFLQILMLSFLPTRSSLSAERGVEGLSLADEIKLGFFKHFMKSHIDGHKMVTRWSQDGHKMVTRWSQDGHKMVTR